MSNGANTDERKVALMLMAMEDLHAEAKGILAQMQAAVSEASAASREVKQAGAAVVPAVNQAASNAVTGSMKRAFADIAGPASSALDEAVKPVMEKFSRLAQLAFEMEKTAQHALRWFSYKWIALIAAAFVGIGAMAWASVWWQRNQVSELTEQNPRSRRTLRRCKSMLRPSRSKARGSKSPTVEGGCASSPARIKPGALAIGTGSGTTRRGRRW